MNDQDFWQEAVHIVDESYIQHKTIAELYAEHCKKNKYSRNNALFLRMLISQAVDLQLMSEYLKHIA